MLLPAMLLLLLTSCANESTYYRITTTTLKCPTDYIYNSKDNLCYYSLPPKLATLPPKAGKHKPRSVKHSEQAINCVKAISQCGFDNRGGR